MGEAVAERWACELERFIVRQRLKAAGARLLSMVTFGGLVALVGASLAQGEVSIRGLHDGAWVVAGAILGLILELLANPLQQSRRPLADAELQAMEDAWRLRYAMEADPEHLAYHTDFYDDLVMADYEHLEAVERRLELAGLREAPMRLHHHLWRAKLRVSQATLERSRAWAAERCQALPPELATPLSVAVAVQMQRLARAGSAPLE